MERVRTIFTCVSLRAVPDGIEVKFSHASDIVILRVTEETHVALGHEYEMSMRPVKKDGE